MFLLHYRIVQPESTTVSEAVISQFMNAPILVSNPLLDYAYSKQDVEDMVIATNRSHKDSENLPSAEEPLTVQFSCRWLVLYEI